MNSHFIGTSGFSERLLKGFFYPEELPFKEYLGYFSQRLKAVEINSTFYRKPTLKTLQNWYACTPNAFQFFIKIPKSITHIWKLEASQAGVAEFCAHIASGLQEKLGGFLFQLPPSFHNTAENLQKLMDCVDPQFLNVVEFRSAEWWVLEVMETLGNRGIVFSGVSIPKDIPDEVVVNMDTCLYYRLHGVPEMFKSEYSVEFLEELAVKIKLFPGKAFVFFNNTYGIAGIKNALQLQEMLAF